MPTQQPRYTPAVLKEPANYGVLEQLAGTWVNYNPDNKTTGWGLHTTCLPSPGTNSETIPGKFHFLCQDYKEELTFTLVPGGVRNRGGANEQFSGAVKYEQSIHDLDGNLLHDENGMYLIRSPAAARFPMAALCCCWVQTPKRRGNRNFPMAQPPGIPITWPSHQVWGWQAPPLTPPSISMNRRRPGFTTPVLRREIQAATEPTHSAFWPTITTPIRCVPIFACAMPFRIRRSKDSY